MYSCLWTSLDLDGNRDEVWWSNPWTQAGRPPMPVAPTDGSSVRVRPFDDQESPRDHVNRRRSPLPPRNITLADRILFLWEELPAGFHESFFGGSHKGSSPTSAGLMLGSDRTATISAASGVGDEEPEPLELYQERIPRGSPSWSCSAWQPLDQLVVRASRPARVLAADCGIAGPAALCLLAGSSGAAVVAAPFLHLSVPLVMASVVSVSTKFAYSSIGASMLFYSYKIFTTADTEDTNEVTQTFGQVQARTALPMCLTGAYFIALASGTSLMCSPVMGLHMHIPLPAVTVHCILDLLSMPLLITNVACLGGRIPAQTASIRWWSTAANVLFLGSSLTHGAVYADRVLCGMGGLAMLKVAKEMNYDWPYDALAVVSQDNHHRLQIAADLLVFGWASTPLVLCLGITNRVSLETCLKVFAALDVMGRVGCCHLMFKDLHSSNPQKKFFKVAAGYVLQKRRRGLQ